MCQVLSRRLSPLLSCGTSRLHAGTLLRAEGFRVSTPSPCPQEAYSLGRRQLPPRGTRAGMGSTGASRTTHKNLLVS